MAVATTKGFDVAALDDIEAGPEHDGRVPFNIRRHFDIRAFGIRVNRAVGEGHVIGEHDEVGIGAAGHEELYFVLSGAATDRVSKSVMRELVVTDSIEAVPLVKACGKVRRVSCAPLIGEAVRRIANEESVSKLFD